MKYAITVIDDSPDSILGRSDDKTEIVIRRRTVVDFEVVQLAAKDAEIAALRAAEHHLIGLNHGRNHEMIQRLERENTSLREEVARLSAPVSDAELEAIIGKAINPGDVSFQMAARQFADELILARKEGR